jgi:hypothetical protein
MKRSLIIWSLLWLPLFGSSAAFAQEPPPPRIGPFVVDVHGTIPRFPTDSQQLADSRGLSVEELPGVGIGADAGVHVYLLKWRAVTFGVGGQVLFSRAHKSATSSTDGAIFRAVTERFVTASPQLSFNFGTGNGWSYLSGGVGRSVWSIHPDDQASGTADEERLMTWNYGGGARWFAKKHLAFSVDLRFYAIDPGTPVPPYPGSPRTTLMIVGAGVSLK